MIRRIVLDNFMSHRQTVIEPAAGLTVLVGPNNCGKSAVVSAMQTLCYNQSGDFMVRHGERECSVTVETDDDHTITWRRRGSVVSYVIDGEEIHRLGRGGTPDRLHQLLRLPKVTSDDAGQDEFEIHFGAQKSPIFLLNESERKAAVFFAASSDASLLLRMQTLHRDKVRGRRKERETVESQLRGLDAELAALAPLDALRESLASAEQGHAALVRLEQELGRLDSYGCHLAVQQSQQDRSAVEVATLNELRDPPTWHVTEPLVIAVQANFVTSRSVVRTAATLTAMETLRAPPELPDVQRLVTFCDDLQDAEAFRATHRLAADSLHALTPPPDLPDVRSWAVLCDVLRDAEEIHAAHRFVAESIQPLTPPPDLPDVRSLAMLCDVLRDAAKLHATHGLSAAALAPLQPPPEWCETIALAGLCRELARGEAVTNQTTLVASRLRQLTAPPADKDVGALFQLVERFSTAQTEVGQLSATATAADGEVEAAIAELRDWAADRPVCQACGAVIDAERLMVGDHAHA